MSDEQRLDDCIRKAVEMEVKSHVLPNSDKVWQRIENNIELFERLEKIPRKRHAAKTWLRVAAVFVAVVLSVGIIGTTPAGEALPFGWVFRELRKIASDDQILIQFRFGQESAPAQPMMPPPPPKMEIEEVQVYQTNLTETTLEELAVIYPGIIYSPQNTAVSDLKTAQYLQFGDKWIIMLDFLVDRHNILLRQEDILGEGAAGIGYGPDTEISFHRLDDVEYMVAELRYGLVTVRWLKDNKNFELTCNLSVEDALTVAQSVSPYSP